MKDIPGYEGLYAITEEGQVYSYRKSIFMKPYFHNKYDNYLKIDLRKDGERKHYFIHRLVALTYIPNPNNYPTVDHIDRNPLNNYVSNLRWATEEIQINNQDRCFENYSKPYTSGKEIKCIELNKIFPSIAEASRQLNICKQNIGLVINGKRKTVGGYHWELIKIK